MGIDVYLRWDNMSEEEHKAQITGFSVVHGHVGYLREAYHGEPYATRVLAPEAFDQTRPQNWEEDEQGYGMGAPIPAGVLRERLPAALHTAAARSHLVYETDLEDDVRQAFVAFVELAERKEAETGKPCRVYASF